MACQNPVTQGKSSPFYQGTFINLHEIHFCSISRGPHNYGTYTKLGGGFKYFLFLPLLGEMIQFDYYFSIRLKPPTSNEYDFNFPHLNVLKIYHTWILWVIMVHIRNLWCVSSPIDHGIKARGQQKNIYCEAVFRQDQNYILANLWWSLTPWEIDGWNIIIEVGKIIFLSKWVIWMFHVNLPGCIPLAPINVVGFDACNWLNVKLLAGDLARNIESSYLSLWIFLLEPQETTQMGTLPDAKICMLCLAYA